MTYSIQNMGFIARNISRSKRYLDEHQVLAKGLKFTLLLMSFLFFSIAITIPLEVNQQLLVGLISFVAVLVLRNMSWSRFEVIAMITLSAAASLRYM